MFGKGKKEEGPISDSDFLLALQSYSGIYAWYEKKLYYEAKYKSGGPTLQDARNQPDLNVTAQLLLDMSTPENIGDERQVFAHALRRSANKEREEAEGESGWYVRRCYRKEAEEKEELARRILIPQN